MAFSIWRIFTYVLGLVGTAMALPLLVAYLDGDTASFLAFVIPMSCGWAAALSFCLAARGRPRVFDVRNAFGVVAGVWIAICLFGL